MRNFRKLEVWIDSRKLVKHVYQLSVDLPKDEKYGLTQQIRRCAISIPPNIAEGCAKNSQKDFVRFLQISLDSLYELESHFLLCLDLNFIPEENLISIINMIQILQKRTSSLIHFNTKN